MLHTLLKLSIVICNVLVKLQDPKASCTLHQENKYCLYSAATTVLSIIIVCLCVFGATRDSVCRPSTLRLAEGYLWKQGEFLYYFATTLSFIPAAPPTRRGVPGILYCLLTSAVAPSLLFFATWWCQSYWNFHRPAIQRGKVRESSVLIIFSNFSILSHFVAGNADWGELVQSLCK